MLVGAGVAVLLLYAQTLFGEEHFPDQVVVAAFSTGDLLPV